MRTVLLFVIAACALASCSKTAPPPAPKIKAGDVLSVPDGIHGGADVAGLRRAIELAEARDDVGYLTHEAAGRGGKLGLGVHVRVIKVEGDFAEVKTFNGRHKLEYLWVRLADIEGSSPGDEKVEFETLARLARWKEVEAESANYSDAMSHIRGLKLIRASSQKEDKEDMRFAHAYLGPGASKPRYEAVAEAAYQASLNHLRRYNTAGRDVHLEITLYVAKSDEEKGKWVCKVIGAGKESPPRWSPALIEWNEDSSVLIGEK
ncbi:hypothetical protein [Planctomyces sp. SH-PL14]|uniref:hypothetical protein n=1 Tax=Planctomyces sp. SH-PL14 TaxID=1632864 RepID=UPI00078CF5F7|nr:hypothetical protein [Planctomyces sp. SH-PL14]AMV19102.1 hypothetical protein VT03_14525 [Planctomyces sp. SH-PL14]